MGKRRAIVLGGGMGGLVAARALAASHDVTVIERDSLATIADARKGTPQARHAHILLGRGRALFGELFPGIHDELRARGAVSVRVGRTVGYLSPSGWSPPFSPTVELDGCSRDLLESVVRERVRARPEISVLDGHVALDLIGDARRITGLRVAPRDEPTRARAIEADLVVDASGRGSPLPKWLAARGCTLRDDEIVDAKVVYASAITELPKMPCGWNCMFVLAAPPDVLRGGAIFPIEGGRALTTLIGMGGDVPTDDEAAWRRFVRTRRSALIDDILGTLPLESPIVVSRSTNNRLRPYDRARLPAGLVPIGDSVAAFNPIYGQGMTVATIEAVALAEEIARGDGFEVRAVRRIGKIAREAFRMAAGTDRRVPGVAGAGLSPMDRAFNRYLDAVFDVCADRSDIAHDVTRVLHLLDPPTRLFAPGLVRLALPRTLRAPRDRGPDLPRAWRDLEPSEPGQRASTARA